MVAGNAPHNIDRYEIRSELRRGGQSTVYVAYDPRFQRKVALKFLPVEFLHDATFLERFKREAQTLANLEHSAIVPVYDFGNWQGHPYLVMRLMTGGNLADQIARGPMPSAHASAVISRIAPALDKAHSQGIIHRDIKPGNILYDEDGKAYLSDFGTVKFAESAMTVITVTGTAVGTPAYMSPEQARATEELDGRSDIYSLGIVLYEMLTGSLPYSADTPMGLAMMHVLEPVPRILEAKRDLNPAFGPIISKALAKDRGARYQNVTALARAVESVPDVKIPESTMVMKTEFAPPDFVSVQKTEITDKRNLPAWLIVAAAIVIFISAAVITFLAAGIIGKETRSVSTDSEFAAQTSQEEFTEVTRLVTEEVTSEVTRLVTQEASISDLSAAGESKEDEVAEGSLTAIGSEQRPIKILFPPIHKYDLSVVVPHGQQLVSAMEKESNLKFDLHMGISYADAIRELCSSPEDTIGILGPGGYVLANEDCGLDDVLQTIRYGGTSIMGMFIVRIDSSIQDLRDLDGLTWGFPAPRGRRPDDIINMVELPRAMMVDAGVEPAEMVEYPGYREAIMAVYEGQADFATSWYEEPILPQLTGRSWQYGVDDPEIWREAGESPTQNEEGMVIVAGGPSKGGYQIMDSRRILFADIPDIFDETRIMLLTEPVPNIGLSFGPQFPQDVKEDIVRFLESWIDLDNPECFESVCNPEYLRWQGVSPASDSLYDPVRFMIKTLGITDEEILAGSW